MRVHVTTTRGVGPVLAVVLLVGLAGPGAASDPIAPAAVSVPSAVGTAPGPGAPASFTLADLAAGLVPADAYNAFWEAEAARIASASCPTAAPPPGSTLVVMTLGATPPAHLGPLYVDHAPLLAAARQAAADRCS